MSFTPMDAPTTTYRLIERVRAGDQGAFTDLFGKYHRRLRVLVHYKLSQKLSARVEVDDLVQEILLRACRDLDSYTWRSTGSFLTWLSSIGDHVIADTARYHGRQRRRASAAVPLEEQKLVDSETPSRVFSRREEVEELLRRLDRLPEQYREAILLSKVKGMSTEEMAEHLGQPRAAVALLVHRALKRFRQQD